jgi:hypothetical protein
VQPSAPSGEHSAEAAGRTVPSAAAVGTPGNSPAGSSSDQTGAATPTAICDGSALSLRAAVDRLSFHRPFTAGITLQIATRSPSPCGLDAGALSAQVLDGSRVLWSSGGCPDAGATGSTTTGGSSVAGGSTVGTATGTNSSGGAGGQNLITVPSQSAADQHYTWHGNVCSGQLAPGRYDVVGRLGLAEAFAGTVTVS